ncbi:DUF1592 domain-containing protein [Myxococcota bacterium]|nr:DUF1592 domain-containing protein [Myxococcota bacterium]
MFRKKHARTLALALAAALASACGAEETSPSSVDAVGDGGPGGATGGANGGGGVPTGGANGGGANTGGADTGGSNTGGANGGGGETGGIPAGDCESTEDFFERRVSVAFMARTCANCHVEGGAAGMTRLRLPAADAPDRIAESLRVLAPLAAEQVRGLPVLLAKPSGQHPGGHGGGLLLAPGSVDYNALAGLAARLTGEDPCESNTPAPVPDDPACEVAPPGARTLRRLSHLEYRNTVRDLFGVEVEDFAPDRVVHGFDNVSSALAVTPLLADQYRVAAERVAETVDLARVLACDEHTRDCAVETLRTFGRKLYRRPLTADDLGRALSVYDLAAEESFEAGVRWALAAMLQSPGFLYRTELGRRVDERFVLTPYEIATELSYLFWRTTPDDALLDRAADGTLLDPDVLTREARRLLEDPRATEAMWQFTQRWLGIDRLPVVTRDAELFPALTPEVRASMAEETARFVGGLFASGGSLADLLRSTDRPLDATLAAYYGLPAPAAPWAPVDVSDTPYGGLLTHGSVLVTYALPTTSSPIHRGLFVRERLLCQDLPDPPANLDTSPPAPDPAASTRERYAEHARNPACAGCHTLIDPIGFAFEHFDAAGRFRERDGAHAIDARGEIVGSPASNALFEGTDALAAVLADSPDVRDCYLTQWIRHGYGVDDALPMACYVNRLAPEVTALRDVLPALAATPHFVERTGGAAELDVPGAELVPTAPGSMPVSPDPPPPPPSMPGTEPPPPGDDVTPGATLTVVEASRWQTGYCANAAVVNDTDAELRWVVAHAVEGRINNLWNAERSADSGRVVFRGVAWNAALAPGQRAEFGWCADL